MIEVQIVLWVGYKAFAEEIRKGYLTLVLWQQDIADAAAVLGGFVVQWEKD